MSLARHTSRLARAVERSRLCREDGARRSTERITPADRGGRFPSTITVSSTAKASTRRCAPTTACRSSTTATCGACAPRREHLDLDVPFDDATLRGVDRRDTSRGRRADARPTSASCSRAASASSSYDSRHARAVRRHHRQAARASLPATRVRHEGVHQRSLAGRRSCATIPDRSTRSSSRTTSSTTRSHAGGAPRAARDEGADVQLSRRAVGVLAVELLLVRTASR